MDISDKRNAVKQIQKFLLAISYAVPFLPHIGIDGIYGSETENAVRQFQHRYGLTESGNVDYATHKALYTAYLLTQKNDGKVNKNHIIS
mgnify:FL=1